MRCGCFQKNRPVPHPVQEPFKDSATPSSCGFSLHRARMGKGEIKNSESVPNGGMNFFFIIIFQKPRWTLLAFGFCAKTVLLAMLRLFQSKTYHIVPPIKLLTFFRLWQRRNELSSPPFQLVSKLPIKKQGGALKLYRTLTDGGRTKFAENLGVTPFNKQLSG